MIEVPRRRFLAGLGALIAAPAIVRVASIMPVKTPPLVYGRSPAMSALGDMRALQAMMSQRIPWTFKWDEIRRAYFATVGVPSEMIDAPR